MRVIQYERGQIDLLRNLAEKLPREHGLRYPEFVDYYYASSPWGALFLAVEGDDVFGAVGMERLRFITPHGSLLLGCGSNLVSAQPPAGSMLFLRWMKDCEFGLVFGGTDAARRMYDQQRWISYPGIRDFYLNECIKSLPDDAWWKRLAKTAVRQFGRKVDIHRSASRVIRDGSRNVEVAEEVGFSADLLPKGSPFTFRMDPDVSYLEWRYGSAMPFVKYRIFRIINDGQAAGYVVLCEQPGRVTVAHCDGDDPLVLLHGILAALASLISRGGARREVFLTCAHPVMQDGLRRCGFRAAKSDRPFLMGGLKGSLPISNDTSRWLVNFDWGDNGLRAPFSGFQVNMTSASVQIQVWNPTVPCLHGQGRYIPAMSREHEWKSFALRVGPPGLVADPRWLPAVCHGMRQEPYVIEATDGGRVVGFLALSLVKSPWFGRFLVSLPYVNTAGVVAEDGDVAACLVDRAVQLADELDVRYLELRHEVELVHPCLPNN